MLQVGGYLFKQAESSQEFEQIHTLNYRTFVREIAQYPDSGQGVLVDKFHDKNIYFIALDREQVVGMISVHGQPPFSIAERLHDPSILTRPGTSPMEVRLLAIEQENRRSFVLAGLMWLLYNYAREHNVSHLFISGVKEQVPLYQHVGFEPLGPAVESGQAAFVPMMATVNRIGEKQKHVIELWLKRLAREAALPRNGWKAENGEHLAIGKGVSFGEPTSGQRTQNHSPVCLLPGPVTISASVQAAFRRPPIYHRGSGFLELFERVRGRLAQMVGRTGARNVGILNGSGTLANEVVAATLAAEPQRTRGLILVNGEFGQRLVRQASRFGLGYCVLSWSWGSPWNLEEVDQLFGRHDSRPDWVWGVHQESSTGVLNDLPGLTSLARRRGVRVCVDCISSLGAAPLDLRDTYLATGATGKALGSYAGAALVFADTASLTHLDRERVPTYLDLAATLTTVGPRYTFPSSTISALDAALEEYRTPQVAEARHERYRTLGVFVRSRLRQVGLQPLAQEKDAAPVITTFYPPGEENSETFVARCQSWGFDIGGASGYLQERRLVQIATMGDLGQEDCAPLFERLQTLLSNCV